MSKNKVHLVVNVLAYLCMVGLASTGLVLLYRLPHGSPRDGLAMLGLDRDGWGGVHWYLAVSLLVLMVLHVVLHWRWVTNTLGSLFRRGRAGAGAGGSLALVALGAVTAAVVAAPWLVAVERGEPGDGHGGGRGRGRQDGAARAAGSGCESCDADCPSAGGAAKAPGSATRASAAHGHDEGGEGHGGHGGHAIRGRTTVAEAAREAGVPVARLLAELKLPADTDPGARFGTLRQDYALEMTGVRDAVERLKQAARPQQK